MSHSREELQVAFDDMAMLVAEMVPTFQKDALQLISGQISAPEEIKSSEKFKQFVNNYGDEQGELFLKIIESALKVKAENIESFCREKMGNISSDDLLPILNHWVKTQPKCFKELLHKYPSFLSFISKHELDWDILSDEVRGYTLSYQIFAESFSVILDMNIDKANDFLQAAPSSVSLMLMALAAAEKEGHLQNCCSIQLSETLVQEEQGKRQQKRVNGAKDASAFLIQIKQSQTGEDAEAGRTVEYNRFILESSILEGNLSFERAIPGQESKVSTIVSHIMGCDTANSDAFEKLALADKLQSSVQGLSAEGLPITLSNLSLRYRLSQGQINGENAASTLDYLIKLKKEELPNITARSFKEDVSLYNQIALELAILEGNATFERAIIGQQEKKSTNVDSVIGSNTAGKSALERLTIAKKSGKLQRKILAAQIRSIDKEILEIDNANSQTYNQKALKLAVLTGRKFFNKAVAGQSERKRTSVASIIGCDSVNSKNLLEKLEALDRLSRLESNLLSRNKPVTLYHLCLISRLAQNEVSEKELAELIELKNDELPVITGQSSEEEVYALNQARLELAVLKGENTVEMMINVEMQKQKVSSILGIDPRKMISPSKKLKAVYDIDILRAQQEAKLTTQALKWIDDQMEKLGNKLKKKPNSTKTEKSYGDLAELRAVVAGKSEYVRSPNPDPHGEARVSQLPEADGNGKKPRLKLFKERFEKHKDVLASKAVSAWATFIEVITNLPSFNMGIDTIVSSSNLIIEYPRPHAPVRRTQSSPNLVKDTSPQSNIPLTKSKSNPNLAENITQQTDTPDSEGSKEVNLSNMRDSFLHAPRIAGDTTGKTEGEILAPGAAAAAAA